MSKDNHSADGNSAAEIAKEFVSDDRCRVRLYDLAKREIDRLASGMSGREMADEASGAPSSDLLKKYQDLIREMGAFVSVVSFWGRREDHGMVLRLLFSKLVAVVSNDKPGRIPTNLWYPIALLFYLAGIGAVANGNYRMLEALFHIRIRHRDEVGEPWGRRNLLEVIAYGMSQLEYANAFHGHGGHYSTVPLRRSEHFLRALRSVLSDPVASLPENDVEHLFHRLEMLQEIRHCQLTDFKIRGCFAGLYSDRSEPGIHVIGPLSELADEAEGRGESWLPLQAGLFGCGTSDEVVADIRELSGEGPRQCLSDGRRIPRERS